MSYKEENEMETEEQLTFGDRINYPFIMGRALLTFLKVITSDYYDPNVVEISAKTIKTLIPDGLADQDFFNDLKNAEEYEIIDTRAWWCGGQRGEKTKENQKKVLKYDHEKIVHACINLLHRRNMLSKSVITEKRMPKPIIDAEAIEEKEEQ